MILGTQGGVRIENSDKLESADLLNENAMFLRSQGFQNEAKMVPKRAERRKKSREEGKRERLGSALGGVSGAPRARKNENQSRRTEESREMCVARGGPSRK